MAEKEIVNVNMYDGNISQQIFKDIFLKVLRSDTISVKGNNIYMEMPDKIYVVDLKKFSFIWHPSFEHIYSNDFPQLFEISKITPGMIRSLYEWINPIFDQLSIKVSAKEKFLQEFQERLETDQNYYQVIRDATIEQLKVLPLNRRKSYIDRLTPLGILTEKDKIEFEYYSDYSPNILQKVFEEQQMNDHDKIEIVSQVFSLERRKEKLSKKKNKKGYNSRIVQLINLLPVNEILDVFISGELYEEEFLRTKVTKKDLISAPYEMLLEILYKKNDILPQKLKITSRDLINEYGRSLNGHTVYKLAMYGYINPEDLVEAYEINKALRFTVYEEDLFEDEELKAYYTPTMIINMRKDQAISPRFLKVYLELQNFQNDSEIFRQKSQMLIEELKRENQDEEGKSIQNEVLDFFNLGLCDVETAKENVPESYIESQFIDNKLTIEEILDYYIKGLIGDEAISKYYGPEELLEMYKSGQVSGICLRAVNDVNLLLQEFCDGKIADSDFIMLYLSGSLSISDLDDGLQLVEKEIDISNFIDATTPYEKIKELFSKYLIDYASILRLHNQGVINDAQLEDIKAAVSTREFFKELECGKTYTVVTNRQCQSSPKGKVIPGVREKKDFSDEIALISEILEKDVEQENYSLIESYNNKGRATSLNNYRIFGNEELDGIVILQKSKKENAVYVMSALQMMYFLKGKENSQGQIEIKNRMKDKAYLKTIEGVEVVEHTEYFARNLVEAAARISPQIAEKMRTEDGKYIADVEKMVTDMRQKYLDDRAKGRED